MVLEGLVTVFSGFFKAILNIFYVLYAFILLGLFVFIQYLIFRLYVLIFNRGTLLVTNLRLYLKNFENNFFKDSLNSNDK